MKKTLLYLLAIITGFICIGGANAATSNTDIHFKHSNSVVYSNCTDSTTCNTSMNTGVSYANNNGETWPMYYNTSSVTLGSAGVFINFLPDVMMQSNYVFSISTIFCFNGALGTNISPNLTAYASYTNDKFSPNLYHVTYKATIDNVSDLYASATEGDLPDKCIQYTSVIVPKNKNSWIGLHLTQSPNATSTNIYFMGYHVESLGVMGEYVADNMASQVDQIVKNSGLATANSVEEVEKSINTMKTEIANKQQETNNKLDETNNALSGDSSDESSSSCGVICKLKNLLSYINPLSEKFFAYKLVELLIDALKSLIVPDDMSFVTDFVDALESKLGFIGAIPGQIIEFAINLVSASWDSFDSISFPSISIFGYNFWDSQEIDLTEAINIFKPFKYVTDCICVVLCARTLNKWREQFTGGSSE